MISISSCRTKAVVVKEVHTERQTSDTEQRSSIARLDSLSRDHIRTTLIRHDTILIVDSTIITRDRWLAKADTIVSRDTIIRQDSIPYPVEGPTQYVRKRNTYDKVTSLGFWLLIITIAIAIAIAIKR